MSFLCHRRPFLRLLTSSKISKNFHFFNFYKNLNFIYKYGIQVGHVGIFRDQNSTFYFSQNSKFVIRSEVTSEVTRFGFYRKLGKSKCLTFQSLKQISPQLLIRAGSGQFHDKITFFDQFCVKITPFGSIQYHFSFQGHVMAHLYMGTHLFE